MDALDAPRFRAVHAQTRSARLCERSVPPSRFPLPTSAADLILAGYRFATAWLSSHWELPHSSLLLRRWYAVYAVVHGRRMFLDVFNHEMKNLRPRIHVMGTPDVSTPCYLFNQLADKNWKTFSFKAKNKFEDEDHWKYVAEPIVPPTLIVQRPAVSPATGMVDTEIVNPEYAEWKKGNDKTMRRIVEMVSDDQVPYIEHAQTAQEMWNNLWAIYEAVGMQSMIAVQEKLSTIKYAGSRVSLSKPILTSSLVTTTT
ncbi:hypothetical protein B0H14DRAFT_3512430 [Mycena olivaceomarginata]|nr:hypothetical protein B0H14DRAFT_3512430 [Mycena olivaceomarginata]